MKPDICRIRFLDLEGILSGTTTGFHIGDGHFYAHDSNGNIFYQIPHTFVEIGQNLYFIVNGSLTKHSSSSSGKLEFRALNYYEIIRPKVKNIECLDYRFAEECLNLIKSNKVKIAKLAYDRRPSQEQISHKDSYEPLSLRTYYKKYDTETITSRNSGGWNIDSGIKFKSIALISLENVDPHYFKDFVGILIMLCKPEGSKESYSRPAMPLETVLEDENLILVQKSFDEHEVLIRDVVLDHILMNKQQILKLLATGDKNVLNMIHFYHRYKFYSQGPEKRELIDRLYLIFKAFSNIRGSKYLKASDIYNDNDDYVKIFSGEKINGKPISETQSIKGIVRNFFPDVPDDSLNKLVSIRNKVLKAEGLSESDLNFISGADYVEKRDNSTIFGVREGFMSKIEKIIESSIGLNGINKV